MSARHGESSNSTEGKQANAGEKNLLELVRMIKDWIEKSFAPVQAERLAQKGRLCARFQVDLGKDMAAQLQAYVAASFALKLLKIRVVPIEQPSKARAPKECVEVVMTKEARALYAEKYPDAVTKHSQQVQAMDSPGDGLVDTEDSQLPALEGDAESGADKGTLALPGPSGQSKRRKTESGVAVPAPNAVVACVEAGGETAGSPAVSAKKASAVVSNTGSVWEQCQPQTIRPGIEGLLEAKDALEQGLAKHALGGVAALKAEKDIVGWLKGLADCEIGPADLQETKVGLVVNTCRKSSEPYIAALAVHLLTGWKRTWRRSSERQPSSADK